VLRDASGVGDQVDWTLVFVADDADAGPDDVAGSSLAATATPLAPPPEPAGELGVFALDGGEHPTRLDAGSLHAFWRAPGTVQGPVRLTGRLVEERHGAVPDGFRRTTGTVAGVQVVAREYVPHHTEPQAFEASGRPAGTATSRAARRPSGWPRTGSGPYWAEDGVLVDLVVAEEPAGPDS